MREKEREREREREGLLEGEMRERGRERERDMALYLACVCCAGDRVLFLEYLTLLKKHKRDADRSRALWSGKTPVRHCAYHENCCDFLCYVSMGGKLDALAHCPHGNHFQCIVYKT